jgi:hypothetical protein
MATESSRVLRRFAGFVLSLLIFGLVSPAAAAGQSAVQPVTSSIAMPSANTVAFNNAWSMAVSPEGDIVVMDFAAGNIYQIPANGGPTITLSAGVYGPWWNLPIAIDGSNNLYLGASTLASGWTNGMTVVPYDSVHKTWNFANAYAWGAGTAGNGYWWVHPNAVNFDSNGDMVGQDQTNGDIFVMNAAGVAAGGASGLTHLLNNLSARCQSVAMDNAGNVYFVESLHSGDGILPGVFWIPAATVAAIEGGASELSGESAATRLDVSTVFPKGIPDTYGVQLDRAGNIFISSLSSGVYMVPMVNGTPAQNAITLVSAIPAVAEVGFDPTHEQMVIPTGGTAWADRVSLGWAELGSSTLGNTSASPVTLTYTFSSAQTPVNALFVVNGALSNNFALVNGGTCQLGSKYTAGQTCTLNLAVDPQIAGNVAAQLALVDGGNHVLSTTYVHGFGIGPSLAVTPSLEMGLGSGLKQPSQVAADAFGNIYVADAGLGKVLVTQASAGASAIYTPVKMGAGTTLTAPSGVAVDAAGDLFVADSGNVYEIPNTLNGLNPAAQTTVRRGLGANLQLAVDGLNNLYIADITDSVMARIALVGAPPNVSNDLELDVGGVPSLQAIALDGQNNLYLVSGTTLYEYSGAGAPLGSWTVPAGVLGVAVDPSGALYLATASGTVRVPYNAASATPLVISNGVAVAPGVMPSSIYLDAQGNLYLTDTAKLNVNLLSSSGLVNAGTLSKLGATSTVVATLQNNGSAALNVSAFGSTADYSVTSNNCLKISVAPNTTCTATVTFNPGPGDQGTLTGVLPIQSNAGNTVVIEATGVGEALNAAKVTAAVAAAPAVDGVTVAVTVAPSVASSTTPTGNVTVSVDGITPTTEKPVQLSSTGTATVTMPGVLAGAHVFVATYIGDRVYGRANSSPVSFTVGLGQVTMVEPAVPQYVLSSVELPYDGSGDVYKFHYGVTMMPNGGATLPTGTVTFWEGTTPSCSDPTDNDPAVLAGTFPPVEPDPYFSILTGQGQPLNLPAANRLLVTGVASWDTSCMKLPNNTNNIPQVVTTHVIVPVYNGDANYQGVVGQPLTFQMLRNPSVLISSDKPTLNVSSSSSATANLTLTSIAGYGVAGAGQILNNYTLPLQMACNGLPAHAFCSFSVNPVTVSSPVTGSGTGTTAVTITTNYPVGTTSRNAQPAPFTLAALFGAGLLGLIFGRRKNRIFMVLCLFLLGGAFLGVTACSTANFVPATDVSTPSGTYAVTITAQQVTSIQVPNPLGGTSTIYGSNNQISVPFTINLVVQ